MKNTVKKILAALLVVVMAATAMFALSSCGPTLFKDNTFKVGATGPLTGEAASYGNSVKNGALLAVEHVNAKGGIQFSFEILDDQATVEDAATNYDTLADAGMQFSLGGVTSGSGKAFAEKANTDHIFAMSPSASADNVIADMKYSFRLCFGDPDQGALAAEYIKDNGFTNVGCIYDTSEPYSSGIYAAFEDKMEELEITYTVRTFDKESKTNFTTQAEALKDCDIIFMPFYYTEASLFIKAAAEKNCDAVYFGCDGFDGIKKLIENVDADVKYITPFDAESDEADVKAFVQAYEAKYNATPDQFAADAYDVVMTFAAALNAEGVTDYTLTAAQLGDILYEAITDDTFSYDGLTGTMTWDESGACTKVPNIKELKSKAN